MMGQPKPAPNPKNPIATIVKPVTINDKVVWMRFYKNGNYTMDGHIMNAFFQNNEFSHKVFDLPEGATVFDVGAHIGLYTLRILEDRPDLNIVCIEPEPYNYGLLSRNMVDYSRVTCLPIALGWSNGFVQMAGSYTNTGSWSVQKSQGRIEKGWCEHYAPMWTLDKICYHLGIHRVDYMKMDIEGAETDIVPILPDWFFDNIIGMDIELHAWGPEDVRLAYHDTLLNFLKSKGLSVTKTARSMEVFQ